MFGSRHWFGTRQPGPPVQPQPNAILMKKLWPARPEDAGALSHLGGDPLLPPEWEWPACSIRGGQVRFRQPMHFLAQIDCAALPPVEGRDLLPDRGILYFFALIHGELGGDPVWHVPTFEVRHFDGPPALLRRRAPPEGTPHVAARADHYRPPELYTPDYVAEADARFGFVPLAFEPMCSLRDPDSLRDDGSEESEGFKLASQAAFKAANGPLGPKPPPVASDPAWPETALHAKRFLEKAQPQESHLSRLDAMWAEWQAGVREGHSAAEVWTWRDWPRMTEAQRETAAREWPGQREEAARKRAHIAALLDALATLPPAAPVPAELRGGIEAVQRSFTPYGLTSEFEWDASHVSLALLRRFPNQSLPLSPTSLAHARRVAQEQNYNANQLLGFAQEVQGGSPRSARAKALARSVYSNWGDLDDMRLLAQFDTCYAGACFMFADCGKLYFYASEADLRARRFDRVVAVVDGG